MNKIQKVLITIGGILSGLVMGLVAHAQTVPTVGTSDIAAVGGPLLSALIVGGEYLMETFGPPLLYFGLVVLIFWAIRSYVGRRHPRV